MNGDNEYAATISQVLRFIQQHLDEEITPRQLADIACYSQHHFHRVFRASVGESVMDHIRRLRLERAAHALRTGQEPVVGIALDAGYGAHEAFTRVFQAYFGLTPSAFRKDGVSYLIPARCGVHYGPSGFSPLLNVFDRDFMSDDDLCPVHRDYPTLFEERWEEVLAMVTGLASPVYSPQLKKRHSENHMLNEMLEIDKEIDALEEEVEAAKLRLIEARRRRPREEVQDYTLKDSDGRDVRLSELFGDKDDLIVVHNMGTGCAYCTLWADGYMGILPHLTDRAAFVISSPDTPDVQKRFAEKRNWKFKMVSAAGSPFTADMGYHHDDSYWPGISTFRRDGGKIYRVATAHLGPNDDFCAVWPFFDLLEGGPKNWAPKYSY